MRSAEQRGSLLAILSGFLYGFIGYFGLSAMGATLSVSTMLFWRFLIASLFMMIIVIPHSELMKRHRSSMLIAYLGGVFFYGTSTILYFYASQYIGSGLSMVIFFVYPVIIMLLNYLVYKQFIPKAYYLSIVVILMGMFFLVDLNDMGLNLVGIILGIASSFCYACYIVSSKNNPMPPNLSTLMVCLGCMTTSLIVSLLDHSFSLPHSLSVWSNLLGVSIIATVFPVLLLLHSLSYISSERASLLSVLEPVFVVILGVLLLGETLKLSNVFGGILVLLGALITLFSYRMDISSPREMS